MYVKLFEDRIFVMILIVILFRQLYKIDSFALSIKYLLSGVPGVRSDSAFKLVSFYVPRGEVRRPFLYLYPPDE